MHFRALNFFDLVKLKNEKLKAGGHFVLVHGTLPTCWHYDPD
jgi:hypothetical protein